MTLDSALWITLEKGPGQSASEPWAAVAAVVDRLVEHLNRALSIEIKPWAQDWQRTESTTVSCRSHRGTGNARARRAAEAARVDGLWQCAYGDNADITLSGGVVTAGIVNGAPVVAFQAGHDEDRSPHPLTAGVLDCIQSTLRSAHAHVDGLALGKALRFDEASNQKLFELLSSPVTSLPVAVLTAHNLVNLGTRATTLLLNGTVAPATPVLASILAELDLVDDRLLEAERHRVATLTAEHDPASAADALAARLTGMAHVAVLEHNPRMLDALREQLPENYQANYYRLQPMLLLPKNIRAKLDGATGAALTADSLEEVIDNARELCADVIGRTEAFDRLPDDLNDTPPYPQEPLTHDSAELDTARREADRLRTQLEQAQLALEQLRQRNAELTSQLQQAVTAEEANALRAKIAGLESSIESVLAEREAEQREHAQVMAQLRVAAAAADTTNAAEPDEDTGPSEELDTATAVSRQLPLKTVADAVKIAEILCPHLRFLPEAHQSAQASRFRRPHQVLDDLLVIEKVAAQWAAGQIHGDFRHAFAEHTGAYRNDVSDTARRMYADDYLRQENGREWQLGPHLARGVGAPSEILRIYWATDSDSEQFVIGHVGRKLRDDSTRNG